MQCITHQFHQQYYKGIKVEGGEFSVHAVKGNIESVLGNFMKSQTQKI
ncbi:MAG: hypothetical protein LBU57_08680 [Dysgonamonadaceae bacterium]|nr:hypothetical protein [Dysgonamonadaceae bacterium]